MGEKTKLLLGRADTGKSVLLEHQLLDTARTVSFRSHGAHGSPAAFLNALLESGGVTTMESSDVAQRNLLVSFLQHQRSLGLDITIAIDGAERLTPDLWRELSRLREIKYDGDYWPNLVLIGRPETYSHMQGVKNSGWESVNVAVHHLPAPGPDEISEYIFHRLETAGLPKRIFSPSARGLIATLSGGSFAWVNILCQWALVLARQRSIFQVDDQLVMAARAVIHSRLVVKDVSETNETRKPILVSRDSSSHKSLE